MPWKLRFWIGRYRSRFCNTDGSPRRNFSLRCTPEVTGGYLGFSPAARQVGRQTISVSRLG